MQVIGKMQQQENKEIQVMIFRNVVHVCRRSPDSVACSAHTLLCSAQLCSNSRCCCRRFARRCTVTLEIRTFRFMNSAHLLSPSLIFLLPFPCLSLYCHPDTSAT